MNSYPPELLAQLAPVMFVAGLGAALPPTSPQGTRRSQDPFTILADRLKDALLAQRRLAVWQPDKSKTFQVVLVEPDVRFPPRKMPPAEDQQFLPTHSPLSPLTPSSPLYPDGLIAPIWIRKHTTLVPSVFVLFMRLYEHPRATPTSPLDQLDPVFDKEREIEERRCDTELSKEIAERKKTTNERSIKLTVVLMASRRMLDDPALDARLTFIRRQSGLDPRAALFVLSPVTQAEIGDFVRSLQEALFEPALEYYTNHSKRVRRKRNQHSQARSTYVPMSPLAAPTARPLRPEGWTVRYEFKMACFAEFRGEDENALKHYQDAYSSLQIMFGSTAILPPRTKRWAEAKVLADCISVKICKLYLYNNEHSLALAHHSSHMRKFADLSRGWGIGEETFEYWSWLARQNRVFAELLEQGTRSTLKIPTYAPSSTPAPSTLAAAQALDAQRGALERESLRSLGLNPTQALQHPGFYYYMAARCTENRRARFLQALENSSLDNPAMSSPGFANENKVEHLTIIQELYTRAYELFKKYSPANVQTQGRQTLWIAYRIAQTYYESGKFDMAVRFFERIAKTYRREKWDTMLLPLLSTWYRCAQQLGDMELSVQLLIEMLAHGTVDEDEPDAIQEDLLAVLRSTVPSVQDRPVIADLIDGEPLLNSSTVFWSPQVQVGEPAVVQLTLEASKNMYISSLPFESLAIHFDDDVSPVVVRHTAPEEPLEIPFIQQINLGHIDMSAEDVKDAVRETEAQLRWRPGGSIVFTGALSKKTPATLTISKLVLTMKEGRWWIELPLQPSGGRMGCLSVPRWLTSIDPARFIPIRRDSNLPISSAAVRLRPHSLQVSLSHRAPAYVGEEYPIQVEVTNTDDRDMEVSVDAMLHPSEIEAAAGSISYDKETWSNLIKGVSFGTLAPGVSAVKTLYLTTAGAGGDRVVDISIRSRVATNNVTSPISPKSPSLAAEDLVETLQTLVVPTVEPISVKVDTSYRRSLKPHAGLADLSTYDAEFWDDASGGEATILTTWTCVGPHGIVVESAKLVREDGRNARVVDSALEADSEDLLSEWLPGDAFGDCCHVSLAFPDDIPSEPIAGPGAYEIAWRRILPNGERGSLTTSRFALPQLKPPTDGLIALLDVPTTAQWHVPLSMCLTIRNARPTRSANVVVQVDFDPSDGFILAGLRSGRIPTLLPGGEEVLTWNMIPVECGYARVPRIKVTDRRNTGGSENGPADGEGEVVPVVDVRWDGRAEDGQEKTRAIGEDKVGTSDILVLVLP